MYPILFMLCFEETAVFIIMELQLFQIQQNQKSSVVIWKGRETKKREGMGREIQV